MKKMLMRLWIDDAGQTTSETAIIIGVMAAIALGVLGVVVGPRLKDIFDQYVVDMENVTDDPSDIRNPFGFSN